MHSFPPHPDEDVDAIVCASISAVGEFDAREKEIVRLLERGTTLGRDRGMEQRHFDAMYSTALSLCDAGDFERALPVALALAAHHAPHARYAFLAGTCLQRTGHPQQAVAFFVVSLAEDNTNAAAALRLGECYLAAGETVRATQALRVAVDLGGLCDRFRPVQDIALDLLSRPVESVGA